MTNSIYIAMLTIKISNQGQITKILSKKMVKH